MCLALVLGILVLLGHVEVWQVMLMAFLLGIVNAFDMPIRQSFVVEMVGRSDIASAVALNSAAFNAARIVGPAIAGLLIGVIGLAPLFLLNALSYLLPITGYLLMDVTKLIPVVRAHVDRTASAVIDSLVEGLRYVRATPMILLCIVMIGMVSAIALNFPVLGPLVARDILGGGAETYGFLMAAAGVGSLISALSLAFGGQAMLGRVFVGASLLGLAVAGVGISTMLPVSVAAHGHRRLVDRGHGRHHQHHHPAHGARRPARPGHERVHHRVRGHDAHRQPPRGRPGESAGGGADARAGGCGHGRLDRGRGTLGDAAPPAAALDAPGVGAPPGSGPSSR